MNKYGGIFVSAGAQNNVLGGAYTQLVGFNKATVSAGIEPLTDSLRIKVPGEYMIQGSITLESADAVFDAVQIELFKNGFTMGYMASDNLAGSINAATVNSSILLSSFSELNARFLNQNVHGALEPLSTGDALSTGVDIDVTKGTGKLILVVNTGGDVAGTVTVTGDTVDRNTGAVTVGDTEDITIDGLSTDTSDTDAEGNPRHALADAYITSKWFRGAITLSTTTVNISDADTYHCSFEQFNDTGTVTLDTFDINCLVTNTAGWLYAYLYSVVVTGSRVAVARVSSLTIPVGISEADHYYRLRESNLATDIAAANSGVFIEINTGPDPQQYWEDTTMKVWATRGNAVSANGTTFVVTIPILAICDVDKGDIITLKARTAQGSVLNAVLTSGSLIMISK